MCRLGFKVGCPSSGVGCYFMVLRFSPAFFSIGVYFVGSQSWRGVSWLLVEFLRVHIFLSIQNCLLSAH
jgi:hypothetical protein